MHLLDRYALSTGSSIEKPYIYETYFPTPFEKYITFQAQSKFSSKDYSYFQDVLDFIFPVLEKYGIKIVQIGTQAEKAYKKVIDLRGQTSFNQLAYIMRRSTLHFGPDSLGVHLASTYDIPIVALYSIIQTTVAGPYFGSKDKHILFESFKDVGTGKPSYSPQENPKSINRIKPEEVANAIFKLLNIDLQVPFKTVHTGGKYSSSYVRQLILNSVGAINNPQDPVEIRMDLFFNEQALAQHLAYLQHAIIITDKRIDLNLLNHFKGVIKMIGYKITNNDEPKFIEDIINLGLPMVLISELSDEEINNKKLNYYEFGNINPMDRFDEKLVNEIKKDKDLYYRSSLLIANEKNIYNSHASIKEQNPISVDGEYKPVIDTPEFWRDLDFYTVVKKA